MPKKKRAPLTAPRSLNEHESKRLLSEFGIPTVAETVAKTPAEAAQAADSIGYPVVVKGLSDTILHKTEYGLVHIGLNSSAKVKKVVQSMRRKFGRQLSGFLIQPLIASGREFIAGLSRDPQFGPVVMFGVGGVQAEVVADVTMRLAPLNNVDIDIMLTEIKAQKLLGPFRGARPVNREQLK